MKMADRRMNIMALCNAEEPVSLDSGPSLPPIASVWYTDSSIKQLSIAAATAMTGKSPSKKRSRRLSNSERGKLYRSRRKNYVQTLEEQVEQLKKEVDHLDLRSCSRQQQAAACLLTRQPVGTSFTRVVNEYFSLFKYGVPVGIRSVLQNQQLSSRQVSFLNGLMHPNVVVGDTYGVHKLLEQWEKYSLYHAGLKYVINSLQIMTADPNFVVLASATLYVRFTRRTIEKIFPHLLWNEALVQRLIGKEFAYPVNNTFYFGDDNKIHRFDTYVNFLATFVSVLGSIEDSMTMMESSLIRLESMIGDMIEEPQSVKNMQGVELAPRIELVDDDCYSNSSLGQNLAPVGVRPQCDTGADYL